jgi:hypothetical protein
MDLANIEQFVADLDRNVQKQNARMRLYEHGGDKDLSCMTGTREGYLRFGIELMKTGLATPAETKFVEADIDYLFDDGSTISFTTFERVETIEELDQDNYEKTWGDRIVIYTIISILIALPILAIIGLITVIRLLL